MTHSDPDLPQVGHPLATVWSTAVEGFVEFTPAILGDRLVVATEEALIGLDVASGEVEWKTDLPGYVSALVGTATHAVVSVAVRDGVRHLGVDDAGAIAYDRFDGWQSGRGGLRGHDDAVVAIGVVPGGPLGMTCRVMDPGTGETRHEVPLAVDLPPVLHHGLLIHVLPSRAESAGLRTISLDGAVEQLHDHPGSFIALAGDVVLSADDPDPRRLVTAYSLAERRVLWSAAAGTTGTLPADSRHVAATEQVGEGQVVPVLLDTATGQRVWRGEVVGAHSVVLTLTEDLVLLRADASAWHVIDRASGATIQVLDRLSALDRGLLVTEHGLIDGRMNEIECLAGSRDE